MYELKIEYHFDAAHKLLNYKGACANLHGHTYLIKFTLKCEDWELKNDMVMDFKDVKKIIKRIIDKNFDHKNLNREVKYNPTAENLAKDIYNRVKRKIPILYSVEIWEGLGTSIKYYRDE